MKENKRVALLIDADNANSELIEEMLNEMGHYGRVTVKRIYADWTSQRNAKWKEKLNTYAIRPIQKFAYTSGKNSTDTALIIEAMDLLHSKTIDAFCIVSSDSDYTGIAHRIREEGLDIYGIGRKHTPEAFKKSCTEFIYEENLNENEEDDTIRNGDINYSIILKAFNIAKSTDDNKALLSKFRDSLKKVDPEFDFRTYKNSNGDKYNSFSKFCEDLKGYSIFKDKDNTTLSLEMKSSNSDTNKICSNIDYKFVREAFDKARDNKETALLANLGTAFRDLKTDFNFKHYTSGTGRLYRSFSDFCSELDGYKLILHDDKSTYSIKRI